MDEIDDRNSDIISEYDERSPYSLFQGPDGRWGVKDCFGEIVYDATYIRQTREDGDDTFSDGLSEVCCFDPAYGFSILAFCDPDFIEWLESQDDNGEDLDSELEH